MIRVACVLAGVVALVAGGSRPEVDAVPFATAFRAGAADQYRNQQVRGAGVNFHGSITERIADGTTRTSLVITASILGVSLLATMMIFPLVFGYGLNPAQGPALVFDVLPRVFAEMPGEVAAANQCLHLARYQRCMMTKNFHAFERK